MSARDDYPILAVYAHGGLSLRHPAEIREAVGVALDEIDELRMDKWLFCLDEREKLHREIRNLVGLLEAAGIPWPPAKPDELPPPDPDERVGP